MQHRVFFATNRKPPTARGKLFGIDFNPAHPNDLRFGEVRLNVSERDADRKGQRLAKLLSKAVQDGKHRLTLYPERLGRKPRLFGSQTLFDKLKLLMDGGRQALVFIHGFNVSFAEAIGSALALQIKLNAEGVPLDVVVFTWPSDGKTTPHRAYWNDRDDATASGLAFSRGFQMLHEFFSGMSLQEHCGQAVNLLCHSMGNFVLENALWHLRISGHGTLPRVFHEILLVAADVDDTALESKRNLGRLPEICRRVNIYYNRGDLALDVADWTKGHPDRLGESGPKHPLDVPSGVVNIDCSEIVHGVSEHSYYLGSVLPDIAEVLRCKREDQIPRRAYVPSANAYLLSP